MEINRDIHLGRLIKSKHNGMIKVVTGIRRCGKSYLLMNLFRQHLLDEGVREDHIVMLDLENRRNKKLRDPDALLYWIDSQIVEYKNSGDVPKDEWYYVMLDEVQLVPEFEDVLNSYLSIKNVDVYVTRSNSKFLSKDVITEFRGRGHEIHVTPLSMSEFVGAHPELTFAEALDQYMTNLWSRWYASRVPVWTMGTPLSSLTSALTGPARSPDALWIRISSVWTGPMGWPGSPLCVPRNMTPLCPMCCWPSPTTNWPTFLVNIFLSWD